jgi:hypothetical protein
MKLYTEEQVKKAIEMARYCEFDYGGVYFDFNLDSILPKLTHIELPSDEEIEKEFTAILVTEEIKFDDMIEAAKWMRDKIQGGNK